MQSVVMADQSGHVLFKAAGKVPVRSAAHDLKGMVPAPGWLAQYDWQSWIPYDQTPEVSQADIEKRGDDAVRDLSRKFDGWDRPDFRLSQSEIDACMAQLSEQDLSDIAFAQTQVRNFAQAQKDSMREIAIETLPGVTLGHKHVPISSVGCYVPGGRYSHIASAMMTVTTAKVAGVPRVVMVVPATGGAPRQPLSRADDFTRSTRARARTASSGAEAKATSR